MARSLSGMDPYCRHWRGRVALFRNQQARIASPPKASSGEALRVKSCTARNPSAFWAETKFRSGRASNLPLAGAPKQGQALDAAVPRETRRTLPQQSRPGSANDFSFERTCPSRFTDRPDQSPIAANYVDPRRHRGCVNQIHPAVNTREDRP